ncbi:hypothetical protein SAMN04487819_108100 [Actinopolyspora alba]|uniref:Uncharacterized protein n=1 Tax=Actinopolyspora alba TaxID=673379 RepID=A0A1I1Y1Q1_9ACTN|nr:hypothetical protein SAMN04487819_108100 [Actinopolyspora alba]
MTTPTTGACSHGWNPPGAERIRQDPGEPAGRASTATVFDSGLPGVTGLSPRHDGSVIVCTANTGVT